MISFNTKYGGGGVKSVQRGVVTPTAGTGAVVTISPVNPAKTFVTADFYGDQAPPAMGGYAVGCQLTSATTLVVKSSGQSSGGNAFFYPASWQVVEFY